MGYPALDISLSRNSIALIVTPQNELVPYELTKIDNGFFIVSGIGVFYLDKSKHIRSGKQSIYIFDARSGKNLDVRFHRELENFAKLNGLSVITRKDVMHASRLRQILIQSMGKKEQKLKEKKLIRLSSLKQEVLSEHEEKELEYQVDQELKQESLSKLKEEQNEHKKQIEAEINWINETIKQQNEKRIKDGETPAPIGPEEYSDYIIDVLTSKKLITRPEAIKLKFDLIQGSITIDDFIRKLIQLKQVDVIEPISVGAELYLESYHSFDPSKVLSYIIKTRSISKKIESLGVKKVFNLIPAIWIITIVIGVVIGAIALFSFLGGGGLDGLFNMFKHN